MVGRVHYGGIRIIGTTDSDPSDSMKCIPKTGEIRHGNKINVVGAGGPMGMMHVIRNICQGVEGVSVFAGDLDEARLVTLTKIAGSLAYANGVEYTPYNAKQGPGDETFDYSVLMGAGPGAGSLRPCVTRPREGSSTSSRASRPPSRAQSTWMNTSRNVCSSSARAARPSTT